MKPELEKLVTAAQAARKLAYAPYSKYLVGAAVLGADGNVYTGANVENASYGLAVCAERAAIVKAINAGAKKLAAVAVVTANDVPAAPCGMCRQTMAEFGDDALPIVLANDRDARVELTLGEILPRAFRGDSL